MPKRIALRPLSEEGQNILETLIKSQNTPAIEVERAKNIWLAHLDEKAPAIAKKQDRNLATIYRWLKRFN